MNYSDISWKKPRVIAKALSEAENGGKEMTSLMDQIFPHTGEAHVVGVTGAPGAGKSSLTNTLIRELRKQDLKVGIIAVDPSSPFSGGAILGDRIRMQDHSLDSGVFIRSMASRGSLGGVSVSTREAISILDAAGFDIIILETVGVGQSEIDVVKIADSVLVVLTPNSGDSIQTMKAGIMEIGNIFVINKSDLSGTEKLLREIEVMLDFYYHEQENRPSVVSTSVMSGAGVEELSSKIDDHKKQLKTSGKWDELREQRAREQVMDLLRHEIGKRVEKLISHDNKNNTINSVLEYKISPHRAAEKLIDEIII
ncbi:methylmalonyl Co-A mutase-associated GTPase MeaB [Natranaerobius trueperi]|uniref:Methylmalonyl Co-A mutase-associated GTPase MeaB n=1 Tax=Natranaerobius trueperi TaxID=759412 RepID=A0A226BXS8_9FIRM|nr:methylmalonyl Co-A mutase-associated GTPase MeaB [Natranaerobius trueperi]OWZ83592.1 methylmalonyl Co-A mutase-associated GTPase MeaB [Natranaerobius trueperi]